MKKNTSEIFFALFIVMGFSLLFLLVVNSKESEDIAIKQFISDCQKINQKPPNSNSYEYEEDQTEEQKKVGLIYYFRTPLGKNSNYFLSLFQDKITFDSQNIEIIEWDKRGKKLPSIAEEIEELISNNFNDKLYLFDHHHNYPPVDILIPILKSKQQIAKSKGFIFDIIITFSDTLDTVSSHFQSQLIYKSNLNFEDHVEKSFNHIFTYFYKSSPYSNSYTPWNRADVAFSDNFGHWVSEAEILLQKFDFIFFDDKIVEDVGKYCRCKLGLDVDEVSNGRDNDFLDFLENTDSTTLQRIYFKNTLDELIISRAIMRKVFKQQFC